MDTDMNDSPHEFPQDSARTPLALAALTALVYVAGFATVAAWAALVLLDAPRLAGHPAAAPPCGSCGVVQSVRELEPQATGPLEGSQAEGTVVLLAALGGASAAPKRPLYETLVQHDDGSVRVLRDTHAPHWQRGDRVRVIMGRVSPDTGAGASPQPAPPARAQAGSL